MRVLTPSDDSQDQEYTNPKEFAPPSQEIARIIDSTLTIIASEREQLQEQCLQEAERLKAFRDGLHYTAIYTMEVVDKYIHLIYGMATTDGWTEQEIQTTLRDSRYCFGGDACQ